MGNSEACKPPISPANPSMNLEIPTFAEQKRLNRADIAFCLVHQPGTGQVWFGSSDANVHHIDLDAEKPESAAFTGDGHSSYVTGLARAGDSLVSSSYDRHLCWWNPKTRALTRKIPAHDKWIRTLAASPDGKTLASVADDMVCRLWDAQSGAMIRELRGHEPQTPNHYPSMLFTCTFSPDGRILATADKVGRIVLWDVARGQPVTTLEAPTMYTWDPRARRHSIGGVRSLAFSPDGRILVAGGMGQVGNIDHLGGKARIRAFDWSAGETLAEIETDKVKGLVEQLDWAPDASHLLAMGGDHKGLRLVIDPKTWKIGKEENTPFHIHAFVRDGARLIAAGHNGLSVTDVS